jgi:hypothetical protein
MSKSHHKVVGERVLSDADSGLTALFPPKIHVEVVASWPPGTPETYVTSVIAEVANQFVEDLADAEAATRPDAWSWETETG